MNKQSKSYREGIGRTYLIILCITIALLLPLKHPHASGPLAQTTPGMEHQDSVDRAQDQASTDLLYRCPMHPEQTSDSPGRCSICGMFLQPEDISAASATPDTVPMPMDKAPTQQAMPHEHEHDHMHVHEPLITLYSCPMHPEEISDMPGRCSICGMTLQPLNLSGESAVSDDATKPIDKASSQQPESREHGRAQDTDDGIILYNCPMHPDQTSDKPGRCPVCGMFLVPAQTKETDPETTSHAGHAMEQATPSRSMTPMESHGHEMPEVDSEPTHQHQASTYVCPMHPQIVSKHPGSCPICGMDLVLKEVESHDDELPPVTLSMAVIQNMGVRSAKVERGTLSKKIRTQGRVTYDDDRIIRIHPRTAGWIENLYVRTDGVRVERKDDLADYFSPDILLAQQDYISSLKDAEVDSFGGSTPDPARSFRERSGVDLLKYFNVPSMDIMSLEQTMQPRSIIPIKAPQGGILIEHNVREGTFVTPRDNIFTIADLSDVWIMVDIFEHQLAWVRSGLMAEVSTPAYPGRTWKGKLDFVYPEVDPKARTMRARLEVKNPGELLLPNMFVQIDLATDTDKRNVLQVPREAVILTGEREVVIKDLGEGRFQPVEVKTGLWNDTHAEILSGLDEDDKVVVSGQFMIDSESSLQASFRRLSD
jgi:Cu(I)/Ag(I) efflux system membrane fusion protein